jgi:nucleotide-binding universal stress UspA family protein
MDRIRTIVVGVAEMQEQDPRVAPPGEDPVLAPAAALAERLGATLHVVQAFDRGDPLDGSYSAPRYSAAARQARCTAIERTLWEQIRRFSNAGQIVVHGVEGNAALQLCAFAEEVQAELIIVGATRRDGMWQNILGSTAERVLRRSPIPVLVMRHPFRRPVRRVLLTTDLSDSAPAVQEAALDAIQPLFGDEPLEVRTLLVCWYDETTAARISQEFMTNAAATKLRQFLAERRRRAHPVTGAIRIGNPSTEIVREVGEWKADLLVLGSHARWEITRVVLGSTCGAVLRASSCNTLVIPAAAAAAAATQPKGNGKTQQPVLAGFPGTEEHQEPGVLISASRS